MNKLSSLQPVLLPRPVSCSSLARLTHRSQAGAHFSVQRFMAW